MPAKPAAIPRLLASVGAVTKMAAVVRIAATVHRTDAIILYALELTFVSPVPLILSLREANFRNNGLRVRAGKQTVPNKDKFFCE